MSDGDEEERALRMELMVTQIERLRQELRFENRKFYIQLSLAFAAVLGVGIAIGRFFTGG